MEGAKGKSTCYEGSTVESFNFLLEYNKQHMVMMTQLQRILPAEFKRTAAGKSSFDVLGVGSGGGQMDVQLLALLQSTCPTVPITADIVEGSPQLSDSFRALVANTESLQGIPFAWHIMRSEDYEKHVKAQRNVKKFDFIHMIHMINYVDDLEETLRFYHSLLKNNGVMLILLDEASCGYTTLWKTYREANDGALAEHCSSAEVTDRLRGLGLAYEEHVCPFAFDITDCFDPSSVTGQHLLNVLTAREHFHQSFTPEIRAGILELLRSECSTEADGRVSFKATFSCILVREKQCVVLQEPGMAAGQQIPFEGTITQNFLFFLEHSGEITFIIQQLRNILPREFERIGAGKSSLDVLGIGSGGGEIDLQMLSLLQSMFPAVPITADIVDNSTDLTDGFKALLSKSDTLQKIPFSWHNMRSEDYEKQVKAGGHMKKFDFIHMIHMVYYLEDLDGAIEFFQSLLKKNGRLLIVLNTASCGWDTLWKAFQKELLVSSLIAKPRVSSGEVVACLKRHGLEHEEHVVPNSLDITECFDPSSPAGERLLSFMTYRRRFSQSFTPVVRAAMLRLLRNKCSTEKEGRVLFDSTFSCILVHA